MIEQAELTRKIVNYMVIQDVLRCVPSSWFGIFDVIKIYVIRKWGIAQHPLVLEATHRWVTLRRSQTKKNWTGNIEQTIHVFRADGAVKFPGLMTSLHHYIYPSYLNANRWAIL